MLEKDVFFELGIVLREFFVFEGFGDFIFEVRSNFVYVFFGVKNFLDVVLVLGRIILVKGRLFVFLFEFGVSKFIVGFFFEVMKCRFGIRSVINICYGKNVERVLKMVRFKIVKVKIGGMNEGDVMRVIVVFFEKGVYDVIIDEGGEGVELFVYIFGGIFFEVLRKVEKLIEVFRGDVL